MFLWAIFISCTKEPELLFTDLYGWVRDTTAADTTGINGLVLVIYDCDPDAPNISRARWDTTRTQDSLPGFFEMQDVCYGTTNDQGSNVVVVLDSHYNHGRIPQYWYPRTDGPVDTAVLYLVD
jgi:hypothetical protein